MKSRIHSFESIKHVKGRFTDLESLSMQDVCSILLYAELDKSHILQILLHKFHIINSMHSVNIYTIIVIIMIIHNPIFPKS